APNSNNQTSSNVQNSKLININTASVGELDSLPEIGEARAKAIIANRPYGSSAELVSKAKIPASVYAKI
ncbi:DNA-binding protein, partial [Candidatus Collierbacteria bacterium CG17_big_fil_post_rev_8_21_14_2_50_45_7]